MSRASGRSLAHRRQKLHPATFTGPRATETQRHGENEVTRNACDEADRRPPSAASWIVPRNDFTQPSRKRTNIRVQQRLALPNRVSIDVMAEAFNVFNQENFTINTQENNAQYLKAILGENRTMQFGFRVTF